MGTIILCSAAEGRATHIRTDHLGSANFLQCVCYKQDFVLQS